MGQKRNTKGTEVLNVMDGYFFWSGGARVAATPYCGSYVLGGGITNMIYEFLLTLIYVCFELKKCSKLYWTF